MPCLRQGLILATRPVTGTQGMKPYIHSERGGIYIIDLIQTAALLEQALEFAYQIASGGGQILFVGTKKQLRQVFEASAKAAGMPYVTERWLGGNLTNFATFQKRIEHLKKLEEQEISGEMAENNSKRDIGLLKEEMRKLNVVFGGLKDLKGVPKALFIADVVTEKTAVREAQKLGIPIIAIVDTNGNPSQIDYIIPANDDAIGAVGLIANLLAEATSMGAAEYKAKVPAEASLKPLSAKSPKKVTSTTPKPEIKNER